MTEVGNYIKLEDISKSYLILSARIRIKVLENITYGFTRGLYILKGKNGSGKSTLLRILSGVLKPSTGKVLIENNCKVAYLPQNPQYHKGVCSREFIKLLIKLDNSSRESVDRSEYWLQKFGITDHVAKLPMELLSEGMKRRVGLAIVFSTNPDIILLDEPFENLDSDAQDILMIRIKEEIQNKKLIIVASHNSSYFNTLDLKELELINGNLIE